MDLPPMPTSAIFTARKEAEDKLLIAAGSLTSPLLPADSPQPLAPRLRTDTRGATDNGIVAQLCGFDPFDLLTTVNFPNDRFERLLRISKDARKLALHRETIPIEAESEEEDEEEEEEPVIKATTTKFQLDKTEGIKVAIVTTQDLFDAAEEARLKELELLKEQLARSAAAIMIQSFVRGFLVRRKFIAVVYAKLTIDSHNTVSSKYLGGLPAVVDLTVQEIVIRKFKHYAQIFEPQFNYVPDYPHFAAAKIQATFRMSTFRKKWLYLQSLTFDEKNGHLGREARQAIIRKAERADYKTSTYVRAARKVYFFYKNLIQFRETGNPCALLKYVNPKESKLIDSACGIHVRFRLGGTQFPPTIYYKIFVHNKLVDMNAFSPRDYTKAKQSLPKTLFNKGVETPDGSVAAGKGNEGWYQRIENNGWRPIIERNWRQELLDDNPTRTAAKTVPFHHNKFKRRQELERLRKAKKLEWMRKLYEEGKKMASPDSITGNYRRTDSDLIEEDESQHNNDPPTHLHNNNDSTSRFETEDQLLQAMADLESELEHAFLMKWSEALDFETYSHDWLVLSTTGRSDDPNDYLVGIADSPLKIALNPTVGDLNKTVKDKNTNNAIKRHAGGVDGATAVDPMLAEIDLFRKIAAEGAMVAGPVAAEEDSKKCRPWSAKSNKSLGDLFFTEF
ncbi:hypothetical protein HDU98_005965 [Podochytrium sp. JEL0797]|nr:hypothetical protein HDU98_005965 [Podochytrium sp. JEL0797]